MNVCHRIQRIEKALGRRQGRLVVWYEGDGEARPDIGPYDTLVSVVYDKAAKPTEADEMD